MTTQNIDRVLDFAGFGGCASRCRLRVFWHQGLTVVVMTETGDNSGTSVTNCVEHIAAQVCEFYSLDPSRVCFVEHYTDGRTLDKNGELRADPMFEEHFDRVTFGIEREGVNWVLSAPKWKRITREEVERWTGQVWDREFRGI